MSDYRPRIRYAALKLRCKCDPDFAADEITTLRQQLEHYQTRLTALEKDTLHQRERRNAARDCIEKLSQELKAEREESERRLAANRYLSDLFEQSDQARKQANQRLEELVTMAMSVRKDLLLRAQPDSAGTLVVDISAGIWDELNRVLGITTNRREGKSSTCTYPDCRCPFDKGQDDPCLKNLPLKPQVVR